jgi:hypothetical protein
MKQCSIHVFHWKRTSVVFNSQAMILLYEIIMINKSIESKRNDFTLTIRQTRMILGLIQWK